MDIVSFSDRLKQITSTPTYQNSDEDTQQRIIRGEVDEFIRKNPSEADAAYDVAASRYKDFRRNTGQGRYIPAGNVEGPWSDPNFDYLNPEEKEEAIKGFRNQIDAMASADPINREDLSYYYNTVADAYERRIRGEDTGWVMDKAYRAWDGLAGFLADAVGASDVANSIRRYSKENPKYDEDLTAMLAEGIGSVGASMAVFIGGSLIGGAASGGNPVGATVGGLSASLAANATVRYNEAYRKAVELGLDESQAVDAGIAAMPAAAIDALSDKLMGAATWSRATSTALKSGSTADKVKAIQALAKDRTARGIMLRASRDAFAEGMSEAVGDYVAGYGAYAVSGEDEFVPGSGELGKSFIVGAILGGGISVGGAAPGVLRGEKATLDAAAQQLQQAQDQEGQQQITYSPESGARISGFGASSQAMRLIASGRYREALDLLKAEAEAAPATTTDSTADSTISLEVTSSENPQFATAIGAFLPSTQDQENAGINVNSVRPFDSIADDSDSLPLISREEQEAVERLRTLPQTTRQQFEEEAASQFNRVYANNLEELAEAISQVPRSRAGVSGIRYGVLEEDEAFWNTPGAEFPIQEAQRVSNITIVPSGTDLSGEENVADFTVVERGDVEGSEELSVQPSPELITKVREAVLRGRGDDITVVLPVNADDKKWLKYNNVDSLKSVPLDGEKEVRKSRWSKTTYYRATENSANFIADELDKKYGVGNWVLKDSVGSGGRNTFFNRQDIIDRIRRSEEQQVEGEENVDIDPLYLNGLYAEPVNPALTGRPPNQDFRVHVIKRNGSLQVIPYATHNKSNAVPYIARTKTVEEIEQAALEYAESIQEGAAENALLSVDVVLGSTGEWIATGANPTQYGEASNYYNFGGSSGFARTPYVASSIYSYLKGRPPAWVFAGRAVLRRELQKKAREQGAPVVSSVLSRIYGDVQDQVQFRAEILKTYGEQFADASGRLWAAFRESAGEVTQKIIDLVRAILRSISSRIPAQRVSQINSGIAQAVNRLANRNLDRVRQMESRDSLDVPADSDDDGININSIGNRINGKSDIIAPLRINGNLIRNSSEALDFLESQGVENLNKLVGNNQLVREALSNIPVFDSKGNGSFYDGTHIRIDGTVRLEDQLRLLEHELFHAVTETALRINDNFRTEVSALRSDVLSHIASGEEGTYQNKVAKILQYARSLDPNSSMDAVFFNNQSEITAYANRIKANPDMVRIAYALTSNSEFLSGLSDYAFRDLLQSVKAGSNKNLFQRIIDAIARFFTGNSQENTLEASERLIKGILDSNYKIQVKPINSIYALDPKRVKSSLQNLVNLKKQNIADRFDINTSRLINILKDFNLREINRLPEASRERVWDLIDNIYNSRSTNTKNPAARIDTSSLIERLEEYKRIIDSIFIQDEMKRLDGILDFSGFEKLDDREAFKEYVQSLQAEQGYQQQANLNRSSKKIEEYNKRMDAIRSKYAEIRDAIVEQYNDADGYVKSIEDNYGVPISSEKLKDFLKIHYDYLTQFADIASMEGDTLNAHFFAINNMLDGRWMNGKETTVEYIRKLRDSNVNFESLADKFRDPVINHGRGIIGQIDQFNKLTEISQVQLERWSRFIEGKDFLQNDLAAGFMESLLLDAENAQNKAKDDYLTIRDKILNGREMTPEDRITMSFASRLIQFNAGSDPNAAFLRNIANERKAFENIVGDPNSEDPKRRQGAGDPSFQREYREVIIPIFEKMVAGLEDSDQPMMDFMNNIEVRMGLGDQNLGAQRKAILQAMQDIQERFSLDNEIISELFYKKPFRRVVNYLPRAVVPINPTMNNDRDVTLENPIEDFENDKFQTSSMTAIPGQLMTRSGINNNSYYVNNIEHIFDRGIRVAAITAHTTAERFILNARLRQGGPVANMINLSNSTYRTDQLKLWGVTLLRNAMQSGNPLGRPGEVMQEFGGAYARVALSGFHQGITQTVAGYVDYQIRTGNIMGAMQAASYYVANKAKMDQWFEENASRIANRSFLGERELDRRKSVELDENSIRNLPFVKRLSKIYDKAGDIITFSLRKGDDFSARSLILAEYHRLLQQKNPNIKTLNDVDWSTVEGDILTRAIGNIEQNINASNKVTRGEFFTDRSKGMMILRNVLFAFSQNVMQLAAQFNLAARDLWELHTLGGSDADKARAIRRMGAIISQTLAFSASRYIINGSLAYVMIGLIRDLFDDEDGKIAELALRVDQARMTGDDALVAQAEYELQGAIAIRKQIEKFSNSNLSFESFFKNTMRESLGTMHFVFNGPAVPQKIVFNVVDTLGESIVKANKEEQVSAIKDKIKDARKKGNFGLAAKLTEDLAIFEAQEWLPFEFDQIRNTGMGGIYGAALGGIYSSLDEFVRYGAGLTEININDFMLAAQAAGLGQADLNRMFRVIDRIEDDEFRRTKTFVEKSLPEARQREAEQKKRRDERELEKALREIFR